MTSFRQLQRELEQSHMELETAYEELQSTNEELETMNEELQSTNEELETINDEVRQRGEDLNQANRFLESVLTSLRSGVAVVDRELRILAWSRHAEELWGLRGEEVGGQHLLNLDIGLPVQKLRAVLRTCLNGDRPYEQVLLDAVNRRGKKILCQISCCSPAGQRGQRHRGHHRHGRDERQPSPGAPDLLSVHVVPAGASPSVPDALRCDFSVAPAHPLSSDRKTCRHVPVPVRWDRHSWEPGIQRVLNLASYRTHRGAEDGNRPGLNVRCNKELARL
ncbi:MAG TPA: PAS domain-containing protein, partial [Gemmatimonadales bacterium]